MQKIVHRALKRKGRNDYFLLSAIFISSSGLTTGVLCLETNILDQHFNHVGALIVHLKLSLGSFSASLVPAIWLQPPPWARDTLNENHLLDAFGGFQCRSHGMPPIQLSSHNQDGLVGCNCSRHSSLL